MSPIYLEVDVYPGEPIEHVATKTLHLANRLNLNVHFDFNGVFCIARPGDSEDTIIKQYKNPRVRHIPYKIKQGNPND